MRLVLDASAALEVALRRTASAGLEAALPEADEVLAPDLFVAEVVNAVWKYHQFSDLSVTVCDRAIEHALALVDTMVSSRDLYREAFALARATRHPVYDMLYLALARREGALFLTRDKALRREARRQGVETV